MSHFLANTDAKVGHATVRSQDRATLDRQVKLVEALIKSSRAACRSALARDWGVSGPANGKATPQSRGQARSYRFVVEPFSNCSVMRHEPSLLRPPTLISRD
ncbi:hypothetical protein DBY65_019730 [Pseudomonas sp. RIT412]|nr:hypothetical protein DBP26_006370 [Pseudomonas sp. RIT 409]RAU52023.1 hypothetical protein DBY65_019730 [Pseudomonas sp. RIT 412]